MDDQLVNLACEYLGVKKAQVVKVRETDDSIIMLVDLGIKGVPRRTVRKEDLQNPKPTKVTKTTKKRK